MDNNKKEEMLNFIEAARVSETNYRTFEISNKLSDRLALAIKEILGIDVSEYKNEIFEDIIRHIELHHGKHGVSDHSMENMEILTEIEAITETFDSISKGKQSTKFKSSGKFSDTVLINKKMDDKEYIVAEAVPISKKKSLEVVTMYAKKYKEDTVQEPDVKSPSITSETRLANDVSANKNMNQKTRNVNERICIDIKKNGFLPTKTLIKGIEKLNKLIGKEISIKDVHNIYSSLKNPEIQDVINDIAKECKAQEVMKNASQHPEE